MLKSSFCVSPTSISSLSTDSSEPAAIAPVAAETVENAMSKHSITATAVVKTFFVLFVLKFIKLRGITLLASFYTDIKLSSISD